MLVLYRYCWVDSAHPCFKAASEGEIFDPILKCGDVTVMGKRTENKYKVSLKCTALSLGAVKKGPCQRLAHRNRKSQKPGDLWPLREHSLTLINRSLVCAYWLSFTSCCLFYLFTSAPFMHTTYASSYPMCPSYPVPPSMLFASKSHLQSRATVTFTAVLLFVLCVDFSPVLSYLFRLVFSLWSGTFYFSVYLLYPA